MKGRKLLTTALVLFLFITTLAVPAAAQQDTGEDEEDDDVTIVDLSEVADALEDLLNELDSFTDDWDQILADTLKTVFYEPFQVLAGALISPVITLLTTTPTVHPNPAVEDVHGDVLLVTYLLSGLVFAAAGLLHMIGPVLGVSYREARKILPRVVLALVFASVSLPLLQLGVDLADALTQAFKPDFFATSFQQLIGLGAGVILAYVIQAILLVFVAVLFVIRDVYILFAAAISPLLALVWSVPRAKRYADTFIAGWFAALMIAPLDMLVLKFSFALMSGAGTGAVQSISNWILGVASLVLLLLVPKQVWDASQAAVGMSYTVSQGVKQRMNSDDKDSLLDKEQRQRLRENRRKRRKSSASSSSYPWRGGGGE